MNKILVPKQICKILIYRSKISIIRYCHKKDNIKLNPFVFLTFFDATTS